jgi:hypothetical protein
VKAHCRRDGSSAQAFDSAELRVAASLTDPEVQQQLDAAGLSGRGARPREVVRQLDRLSEGLWRPRADCRSREVESRLARCQRGLQDAQREADR